ncbi:MAG: rod-binding protein [Pseudomonadota bacterium]
MIDGAPPALPTLPAPLAPQAAGRDAQALRRVAVEFEAAFLTEMLNHAGVGSTPEGFGGGAGEDAFGSLLTREHARLLAEQGGIGLADAIEASLARRGGAASAP